MINLELIFKMFRSSAKRLYYYVKYRSLMQNIISYLSTNSTDDEGRKQVLRYIKKNRFISTLTELVFPYEFVKKYERMKCAVYYDQDSRPYIKYCNKKMYFKKSMNVADIKVYWTNILIEQDIDSPHRYPIEEFDFHCKTVADCGAAEGCFALSIIDQVSHIYLFECDEEWIEAIEKTFAPFKDKVTVVKKFVGSKNDQGNVSMDEYFENKELDCLKADIEGAEIEMLLGAERTFKNKIKFSMLCAYHRQEDAERINIILEDYGFFHRFTEKYIVFIYDPNGLDKPYLRHAIVIGEK